MSTLDLAVKPNPQSKTLNIRFGKTENEGMSAVLLNLDGQIVYEFDVPNENSSIDLLNLPHSIYILQVYDSAGNMQTYKLIKS
jgi:hypothetical protein